MADLNKTDEITQDLEGLNVVDKILSDIDYMQDSMAADGNSEVVNEILDEDEIDENTVTISYDLMSASIYLVPPKEGETYTKDDIIKLLHENGVYFGVSEAIIDRVLFEKGYNKSVAVAFGQLPVDGENGRYVYHFNTNPKAAPKLLEDGSVDYHHLNAYESVKKDQLIAEYIKETAGKSGRRVDGVRIEPAVGKPLPAIRSKHIYRGDDEVSYYSDIDGKIEFDPSNGFITITNVYTVSGDVDVSTGDIKFPGNVEITGSVRAGYKVEADGSVVVNGVVEAGTIIAGKDIMLKGGMMGSGKGILVAGGNVEGKFFEQANIDCGGYLHANSVINCYVDSNDYIEIQGSKGVLLAGRVRALKGIKAVNIGNDANVHTYIKVGLEPKMRRTYKLLTKKKNELETDLEKIAEAQQKLNDLQGIPGLEEKKLGVMRLKITKHAELDEVEKELAELDEQIEAGSHAKVIATNVAFRGCSVTINGATSHVTEDIQDVVFSLHNDKVIMSFAGG